MSEAEELYRVILKNKKKLDEELKKIETELAEELSVQKSIVIKEISGKLYYYVQWRDGKKICTEYVGRVRPGLIAGEEQRIQRREELLFQKKEKENIKRHLEKMLGEMEKDFEKTKIIGDYYFEVYWKDEITARVHVEGSYVRISRYTSHPLKQLFANDRMSRHQLNRILEMRCWDKERADIGEILKGFGLREYNPYEIVRKTHGVSYNDYIWFRFPGEQITGKDVLVREYEEQREKNT